MARYRIEVTEEAQTDLRYYTAFERKIITSEIRAQLSEQPLEETKNRKPLRENPIATWELRIGRFRAFYDVDEDTQTASIVSVGHKEHNVLLVRGKEVIV
jgi:mRNA-degrading endonuclease RelE of RelBE toxin-antitoxin system